MTVPAPDHPIRRFADDAAIRRIGTAFLDHSLPAADWTHEAHLGTCAWLQIERPDIDPPRDLPRLISTFNVAKGTVNDDKSGYHETITQAYAIGVRTFLDAHSEGTLCERINALLSGPTGARDWPLRFWSRDVLFSVTARRGWVEPDLAPLPGRGVFNGTGAARATADRPRQPPAIALRASGHPRCDRGDNA